MLFRRLTKDVGMQKPRLTFQALTLASTVLAKDFESNAFLAILEATFFV